jgi:hypothetical protein
MHRVGHGSDIAESGALPGTKRMDEATYGSYAGASTHALPAGGSSDGTGDGPGQDSAGQRRGLRSPPARSRQEAFLEQATDELRRAARHYARGRAAMVRRAGGRIDHLYADELVADALADTWIGTQVSWDPTRRTLLEHIRYLIRSRAWKDRESARQRPHVSIDWDSVAAIEANEPNWHAASQLACPPLMGRVTTALITELQGLASDDEEVLAILGAWRAGLSDREDVLDYTGLSAEAYRNARARVTYLLRKVPQGIRDAATTLLGTAP